MGYMVFKYSNVQDLNKFSAELETLLQSTGGVTSVKSSFRYSTNKAIADMTADQLVAQLVLLKGLGTFDIWKCKKDITTDNQLVSTYGARYFGYVSGVLKKDLLLHMLDTERKMKGYTALRANKVKQIYKHTHEGLILSAKEMHEYIAELDVSLAQAQIWIDKHSKSTADAHALLPEFLQRGF